MKIYFCLGAIEFQCNFVLRPSKVRKLVRTNQFQVKSTKMGTVRKICNFTVCAAFTWAAARSQQLLFVVLAGGFWCFTAGWHVKSPLFPHTPTQTEVCSTMGESIRPSSFHNPTLSANKHAVHVVQIYRSSLSAAVQTVQVSVEPRLSTALKVRSVVP